MTGKYTTEQLLQKFHSKHGNKYTYPSDLSGLRLEDKIPIFCPIKEHGVFYQKIFNHIKGQGCPKCGRIAIAKAHIISREVWIERFEKIHGKGKYDYSKLSQYPRANKKFPIYCKAHDLIFNQTPNNHLYFKQECPKCGLEKRSRRGNECVISRKYFLNQAQAKNGLGYEYINLPKEFSLNDTIGIFCSAHNKLFFCKVSEHLEGKGCPDCESGK